MTEQTDKRKTNDPAERRNLLNVIPRDSSEPGRECRRTNGWTNGETDKRKEDVTAIETLKEEKSAVVDILAQDVLVKIFNKI